MLSSSSAKSILLDAKQTTKKRPRNKFWHRSDWQGYLYIAPWLFGFLCFGLWPLINTFYNSFTEYNLFSSPEWLGFDNYIKIFATDQIFRQAAINMLVYVPSATLISILGGLGLALLLNRSFPGNHFFRTLFYIPSLLVGVAIGLLFKKIFATNDFGLANSVLGVIGLGPYPWLQNYDQPLMGVLAMILVNFWFIGGTMLIFLAGLKGISQTYFEAAKIDGANSWHTFWHVTLPLLTPTLVFNTIMSLIGHLQVFETPLTFAATQGAVGSYGNPLGYRNSLATFLTYIYKRGFVDQDFGYASAMAVIVFLISLVLALLVLFMARYTYYGDQVRGRDS